MSKSGYLLGLVVLTAGVAFAGCIVEYDGNEAGAGASTGGASAAGGPSTSKGGASAGGPATSGSTTSSGCSLGHPKPEQTVPATVALALALGLSLRRRQRGA